MSTLIQFVDSLACDINWWLTTEIGGKIKAKSIQRKSSAMATEGFRIQQNRRFLQDLLEGLLILTATVTVKTIFPFAEFILKCEDRSRPLDFHHLSGGNLTVVFLRTDCHV